MSRNKKILLGFIAVGIGLAFLVPSLIPDRETASMKAARENLETIDAAVREFKNTNHIVDNTNTPQKTP